MAPFLVFFAFWIMNGTCQYDCSIFSISASKMRVDFKLELCNPMFFGWNRAEFWKHVLPYTSKNNYLSPNRREARAFACLSCSNTLTCGCQSIFNQPINQSINQSAVHLPILQKDVCPRLKAHLNKPPASTEFQPHILEQPWHRKDIA